MDAAPDLGFVHHFSPHAPGSHRTLLLLHGTGGDERDLLPLGAALSPGAALLSPRGRVLEHGMPRFFRRLAEGVFDQEDLRIRTHELADFVQAAAKAYDLDTGGIVAVGFSNGANIAASMLLLRPGVLAGAVLIRAMVPFEPPAPPRLSGVPVLLLAGRADPIVPPAQTEALAQILSSGGASVLLEWQRAGHQLTPDDVRVASAWLASLPAAGAVSRGVPPM